MIYHIESWPTSPSMLRTGVPLGWHARERVSTDSTEPADYPSVDFKDADDVSPNKQLIVCWHGPGDNGRFPGDAWSRIRRPDGWQGPRNVSSLPFWPSPMESQYPESSTPDAVAWEEAVNQGDIYGNFWGQKDPIVVRPGEDRWPHVAARTLPGIAAIECHTLWSRPGVGELHYRRHYYIPRAQGPGEQSRGNVRVEEGEAYLYPVAAAGGHARIRYFLTEPGRVALSIFDKTGRLVRDLRTARESSGSGEAIWDGTTSSGCTAPAGMYVCLLRAGRTQAARSFCLLR